MKKSLLCSLVGTLFLALPIAAVAQVPPLQNTTRAFNNVSSRPVYAYDMLDGTTLTTNTTNDFRIADGTAGGTVPVTTTGANIALVYTEATGGTFNLSSFTLGGKVEPNGNHSLLGFLSLNDTAFGGTINAGGTGANVTVIAAPNNAGEAIGVLFRKLTGGRQDITGNVTFGTIDVSTSGTDGAYGFSAGGLTTASSSVTLGNVTAHTLGGPDAAGVEFRESVRGTLSVGNIDVKAKHLAHGLTVTKDGGDAHLGAAGNYASVGSIIAETTDAARNDVDTFGRLVYPNDGAYGIFIDQGDAFLNLKGNITANARHADGVAYGIGNGQVGGDVNLRLDNTATIKGTTADIQTTGDLSVDLNSKTLTFGGEVSADVGKNMTMTTTTGSGTFVSMGSVTAQTLLVNGGATATFNEYVGTQDSITVSGGAAANFYNDVETDHFVVSDANTTANAFDGAYVYVADMIIKDRATLWSETGSTIDALDLTVSGIGTSANLFGDTLAYNNLNVESGAKANFYGYVWTPDFTVSGIDTEMNVFDVVDTANMTVSGGATANLLGDVWVDDTLLVDGGMVSTVVLGSTGQMVSSGELWAKDVQLDNSALLRIDGSKTMFGTLAFQDTDSKLQVYGDAPTGTVISPIVTFNGGNADTQIFNLASLTQWGLDGTGQLAALGVRTVANANDNYLAAATIHHKFTAWHATRDHLISGATVSEPRYGYYGQSPCDCTFGCTQVTGCKKVKSRGAWVNYIGRETHYQSSFNRYDWKFTTHGVQIGTDIFRTGHNQFGTFFGYENSNGNNINDRIKANDYYVGLYGVHVFQQGADLRALFNYGWQDFDSLRITNGTTNGTHQSLFKGNTAEVNLELGKRYYVDNWSTRPAIALDWYLTQLHGGLENPGNAGALRYDAMDLSQFFFRFGTDLRYELGSWAIEGGLFYSYDLRGADLWSGVSDADSGLLRSTLVGSKLGRSVVTYNVGSSYAVGRNFTIFGGYRGEVAPERAGRDYAHIGYFGGAWRW